MFYPNPNCYTVPVYDPDQPETQETQHPIAVVHEGTGLRLVLDATADLPVSQDAPNLLIERHADHWLVIVQPHAGDPICTVELRPGNARVFADTGTLLCEADRTQCRDQLRPEV